MSNSHDARIDLNLLETLSVVLDEGSVSAAAARLGVTQSAVSHSLARLRAVFADPLVVRTRAGMEPTALAAELRAPLAAVIAGARRLVRARTRFDPATSDRTFTLCAPDSAELVILPTLCRRLATDAPRADLVVRPVGREHPLAALERGEVDLSIGMLPRPPAGLRAQKLYRERFVCMVRRDHPAVGRKLSLEDYARLSHILVAPRGSTRGMVDPILERAGHRRRVAVIVPQFLIAPMLVAQTDLVLTIGVSVARPLAELLPVRLVRPPIEIDGYDTYQIWHDRQHADPGHVWFRQLVAKVARAASAG